MTSLLTPFSQILLVYALRCSKSALSSNWWSSQLPSNFYKLVNRSNDPPVPLIATATSQKNEIIQSLVILASLDFCKNLVSSGKSTGSEHVVLSCRSFLSWLSSLLFESRMYHFACNDHIYCTCLSRSVSSEKRVRVRILNIGE